MSYVEFPTDRIVDVHFKKKPDEGPPSPCQPGSELCNTYSFFTEMKFATAFIISSVPTEQCSAPFVGGFSTIAPNGSKGQYGGLNHPIEGTSIPEFMTAAPYGLVASSVVLDNGNISFTNQQLQSLPDQQGNIGTYGWTVPMAQGSVLIDPNDKFSECIPLVINTYTWDFQWNSSFLDGYEFGVAIQHPLSAPPGETIRLLPPSSPLAVVGEGNEGTGSYSYPFRWKEWALNEFHYDEGNQYSDALGGPAFLWWMTRRNGGDWTADSQIVSSTLIGLGDTMSWSISATCMMEPSLFSRASQLQSRRRRR